MINAIHGYEPVNVFAGCVKSHGYLCFPCQYETKSWTITFLLVLLFIVIGLQPGKRGQGGGEGEQ